MAMPVDKAAELLLEALWDDPTKESKVSWKTGTYEVRDCNSCCASDGLKTVKTSGTSISDFFLLKPVFAFFLYGRARDRLNYAVEHATFNEFGYEQSYRQLKQTLRDGHWQQAKAMKAHIRELLASDVNIDFSGKTCFFSGKPLTAKNTVRVKLSDNQYHLVDANSVIQNVFLGEAVKIEDVKPVFEKVK